MEHNTPCLAYSFTEKEKLRINKNKLKKLGIKGKLIGELAKGKDIVWNNKKIKSASLAYKQESRKIAIILDTKINENCYKLAKNSDLLICESTFMEDSENGKDLAKEYKHLTAKQSAEIAKKSKSKKLVLTHLSQRYENKEKLILAEARKVFKNTEIAYDLMKTEV
jgi:ribonuclease Z